MRYIVVTKLEYPTSVSLLVKGLATQEIELLTIKFSKEKIKHSINDNVMEIDLHGIQMINILANEFGYRVVGQAMAMEVSDLGGRSFQIEKIVWTLERSD